MQIIDQKEFAETALDVYQAAFMVDVAILFSQMAIYPFWLVQITSLKAKKALVTISDKYLNYANDFSKKLIATLLEHTMMNTYTIELKEDKQLLYGSIYSPEPIELETLKTYIKTNLANDFI